MGSAVNLQCPKGASGGTVPLERDLLSSSWAALTSSLFEVQLKFLLTKSLMGWGSSGVLPSSTHLRQKPKGERQPLASDSTEPGLSSVGLGSPGLCWAGLIPGGHGFWWGSESRIMQFSFCCASKGAVAATAPSTLSQVNRQTELLVLLPSNQY